MNNVHLICNAHLDPAWLWQIEEGAGEALSTFRIAADFCEKFDGFVFNHNEVILYKWVEEYEPALFRRIQKLVAQGKWHIMGGWYLQPDCNMPSGESFVRQILVGRRYFAEKFGGVRPTTAINFDPFGHTRGLVQIMRKAGFDSYIVCRPGEKDCPLPGDDFIWVGYDGSEVIGHRAYKAYLSGRGRAHLKIEGFMTDNPDKPVGMVLWGIGNHGGGPSKLDLENLQELKQRTESHNILHSTPEQYFRELREKQTLPRHEGDLNPWAVGCYTSQIRIKQKHRLLENELYFTEKMMSSAAIQGLTAYPHKELQEAQEDLLIAEFHDILPGSSVRPVEEDSLRLMDHGLEILSRLKARAFFALASGQKKAEEGSMPLFLYNPHPYKVKGLFEIEFQPQSSSKGMFANPVVYQNGERLPGQVEKELSNLYIDWRKRVVFYAELEPSALNRFDCRIEALPERPKPQLQPQDGRIVFETGELRVVINAQTGFVDEYAVNGASFLKPEAFRPIVMQDHDDAWGSNVQKFPTQAGTFKLMTKARAMRYSGLKGKPLDAVRVIEDGDARTVVEALFEYRDSMICMRYNLPKVGTEVRVDLIVHWNEKRSLLKLALPTALTEPRYRGQVAYGSDDLPSNGREVVAQKWVAAVSDRDGLAFTCINDGTYGSDMTDGEIRLTMLRSPGYSALLGGKKPDNTMPADRFSDRIDQGERRYSFWFNAGASAQRLETVDREALAHNEKPYALTYFPSGKGKKPLPLVTLSDEAVQMTAFKRAEDEKNDYIIRLFEPTGTARTTTIDIPPLGIREQVTLKPFEIKTYRTSKSVLREEALLEDGKMEGDKVNSVKVEGLNDQGVKQGTDKADSAGALWEEL